MWTNLGGWIRLDARYVPRYEKELKGCADPAPAPTPALKTNEEDVLIQLTAGRFYSEANGLTAAVAFDPRLLVFDYLFGLMLRKSQVDLIQTFVDATITKQRSIVHQMLMGQGKTTVIMPLLSLLLGEKLNNIEGAATDVDVLFGLTKHEFNEPPDENTIDSVPDNSDAEGVSTNSSSEEENGSPSKRKSGLFGGFFGGWGNDNTEESAGSAAAPPTAAELQRQERERSQLEHKRARELVFSSLGHFVRGRDHLLHEEQSAPDSPANLVSLRANSFAFLNQNKTSIFACMPEPLIDMSRCFLQSAFSSPALAKPVITFKFSRYDDPTGDLVLRLESAVCLGAGTGGLIRTGPVSDRFQTSVMPDAQFMSP